MANTWRLALVAGSVSTLVACTSPGGLDISKLDPDLRSWGGGGLDTAPAAAAAMARPAPDSRGIISYPRYQVVVARQGDTVASIASRLGQNPTELARYNAIGPTVPLNAGSIVALPRRVAGGAPVAAAPPVTSSTGQVSDPFAGQGVKTPNVPAPAGGTVTQPASAQPRQHVVRAGETGWSVARKYNVSVKDLAAWNGLPSDMSLRTGQRLLIPVAGQRPATSAAVTAPGAGSPTPTPPSSSEPLPKEKTQPSNKAVDKPTSPDLGKTRTAASGSGKFRMPANGAIIRAYEKGKNEGIDISAAPGSAVTAAGSGTVAAITRDTDQVPIIVVRHDNNLMTVYAGLSDVAVSKGQSVKAGTPLGKARNQGVVHFEVRNGFESVDPEKYLN